MPARAPYIPRAQVEFDNWAKQFSTQISAAPEKFQLAAADAEKIAGVVEKWQEAFRPVTCDGTKTKCTVRAKDDARLATLATLRFYAQEIARSPDVSPTDKDVVGVNSGREKWTRIAAPASHPIVCVKKAIQLRLTVQYVDSVARKRAGAKPYGVGSCQIFYTLRPLSDPPVTNRAELTTQITATRSQIDINFPDSAGGQQCYLSGYWLLRNGKRGGWGPITSFTVPRG